MNEIKQARAEANKFILLHPIYASEVRDLLSLMESEIEEGSSPQGELDSFLQSLDQLLEENES